jgi:hypothetical protein
MALKDIMSISGYSGLYKFISQGRSGIIVESLTDGKRMNVPASAKASALSDIAVFTTDGEKSLREVLDAIKQLENSKPTISHKSDNSQLKAHFLKVLPNFDTERVYMSDIKKVFTWYNQLQALSILDFSEPVEEKVEEVADSKDAADSTAKPKAKKAAAASGPAPKKETKKAEPKKVAPKSAAPAKKATVRKKAV